MIGTKLYKNNPDDMARYTEMAQWCNKNNAHIEDKGEYYEVVENPGPTKEEKLAACDAAYDADKAELVKYYGEAALMGDSDTQVVLQGELQTRNAEYIAEREAIEKEG